MPVPIPDGLAAARNGSFDKWGKALKEDEADKRARRRQFLRALADLLEEHDDVAQSDGELLLDGGQWKIASITRGR